VAIDATSGMVHLPFAQRPGFGTPYPEGMAVAHIDVTGDATGGAISATILADGGFLYRFELFEGTQGDINNDDWDYITSHRWAADRSGRGAGAFDLNWITRRGLGTTFSNHRSFPEDLQVIRRFPMGRTDNVALQTLFTVNVEVNRNAIDYNFNLILTYWRTEATYRPGFLQAFWEAPVVPVVEGVQ